MHCITREIVAARAPGVAVWRFSLDPGLSIHAREIPAQRPPLQQIVSVRNALLLRVDPYLPFAPNDRLPGFIGVLGNWARRPMEGAAMKTRRPDAHTPTPSTSAIRPAPATIRIYFLCHRRTRRPGSS
jgi:hypothetical protein